MKISLSRKSKDKFEWAYRGFKSFDGQGVSVGIHKDKNARPDSKLTNAQIAANNEWGTPTQPERSFFRSAVSRQAPARLAINAVFASGVKSVMSKKANATQINRKIGKLLVKAIVANIDSGIGPANAPSTIAAKGNEDTLRETKRMRNAIAYKVKGEK